MDTEITSSFWSRLAGAPAALLALDYDGTLAPFQTDRDAAVPYPGVRDVLSRIRDATATRLLVISGRPPAEVARLLGLQPPPEIHGGHGWEFRAPDGAMTRRPLPAQAAAALDAAHRAALAADWGSQLERKYASLALHWRGTDDPESAARSARALLTPHADVPDLDLLEFAAGLELRCGLQDKGRALASVLADLPPDTVVAYLGDDRTDEDAFTVLAAYPDGLPLLVAETPRATAAGGRLKPPDELLAFLERWFESRKEIPT